MENKKNFWKGCIVGLAFTLAVGFLSINITNYYRRASGNLTYAQKIEEIENIVSKYSVNEFDEDAKDGMYKGLVATLNDPYSYYMSKDEFVDFIENTEGNYVGIGVYITVTEDGEIVVYGIFDDSPAKESGILAGDIIKKVNGEEVTLDNYENLINKIKGEEGTKVNLTILRDGEELEFEVLRQKLDVQTVEYKMLEDNIGYIRISQFDRVTTEQFKTAFEDLQSADGMIIDLRDNPGGLLTTVCEITDLFVPEGTITYIEDKYGNKEYQYSDEEYYGKPLVVLVNGNSASASEVFAGAIKDYGVGALVGETTFGKGVVQNIYSLSDGSGLKVTIAKYYTPNGICIDGTGIEPDYYMINNSTDEDLQLEKAIEVIKNSL